MISLAPATELNMTSAMSKASRGWSPCEPTLLERRGPTSTFRRNSRFVATHDRLVGRVRLTSLPREDLFELQLARPFPAPAPPTRRPD